MTLGSDALESSGMKQNCYSWVDRIMACAKESVGLKHGTSGGKEAAQWFAEDAGVIEEAE